MVYLQWRLPVRPCLQNPTDSLPQVSSSDIQLNKVSAGVNRPELDNEIILIVNDGLSMVNDSFVVNKPGLKIDQLKCRAAYVTTPSQSKESTILGCSQRQNLEDRYVSYMWM